MVKIAAVALMVVAISACDESSFTGKTAADGGGPGDENNVPSRFGSDGNGNGGAGNPGGFTGGNTGGATGGNPGGSTGGTTGGGPGGGGTPGGDPIVDVHGRQITLTGYQNTVVASSTTPGVMVIRFSVQNMKQDDSGLNIRFPVHSVDFSNINSNVTGPKTSAIQSDRLDYDFTVNLNYKAVANVTRYKYQKFELTFTNADGTAEPLGGQFHMIVRPEGAGANAPVVTELEGTAGQ